MVSQFSGGSVQANVVGNLNDEGSQYQATDGALKITAGSHVATAAANTRSSSEQGLDAKVGGRVYTTTGADVNARGSGTGGSRDVQEASSTAVVGSYAGTQGLSLDAKGDARYEGSHFNGAEAGVNLKAGGELALNQANDTKSQTSNTLRGTGLLTVGTLPGASGTNGNLATRLQLDHKRLATQDSQAHVASIESDGPVQLTSGANLILQGTQIGSSTAQTGDISLNAGGKLDLQAATNTHASDGSNLGGGLSLGGTKTSTAESSGSTASLSANFNIGKVVEKDQSVTVGQLHSNGKVSLASGAKAADAIHLQGTQLRAASVSLDAHKGGILQESAQSTKAHDSWGVALGAGGTGGKTTLANGGEPGSPETQRGINLRAKVDVDYQQGTTQHDSLIKADNLLINSAAGTRLAGARIEADQVSGKVGGDLVVESRNDQVNSTQVNVDARLDVEKRQPGVVDKLATAAGPLKGDAQNKAHGAFDKHREKLERVVDKGIGSLASSKGGTGDSDKNISGKSVANSTENALFGDKSGKTSYTPTVKLEFSHTVKNSATQVSGISGSRGVNLQVGGDTRLVGARISASDGKVELGGSTVTATTLAGSDYRANVGLNFTTSPVETVLGTKDALTRKKDETSREDKTINLGPLRVSGHSSSQELQAGIDQKVN